ncbi:uncharacterized protein NFIA_053130 [Aspergillus fischeri NRRL 181]|uniref:Shelterin complex subunit TPP1/Est3 domain-containing protein n=1 Tax=Neosartorya fischeri (strain ATCC 1020 / DSM 3700 / CBS 544.65 / FGSC A1164 / JCM 1740 / NRRL 181 / WB 181) TaxID=331117 RepID=A1DME6_NEOFI|nr:uncharacterized protein NFIA_053130 [Aspergillus fischeri NRRL 181]EAW15967.1 hypothetical protein NFIA_053130 [Aspergillus fischeri NRRL 181]KAG2025738.1 hypothetical protein GB937_002460 [Aspergillus fischeri]
MASSGIWISPLIERSLNHYLEGPNSETRLEDDGSNLRFADNSPHSALIVEWTEDERSPMPILTDTNTQIQAILARESLEEYHRDYPDRPLSGTRGHTINLLDFELVFEYTTSEPKLHLYVKRFSIAWDKSRFKGPPQGKKIRNKREVYDLMRSALLKAKSRETATTDSARNGNHSDESIKSQDGETDGMDDSQNQLMSQMPPKQPVELFASAFASAKTLLGSLKPSARLAQDSQQKKDNDANVVASGRGHHAPDEATKEPNINRCAAHIDELSAGPLVVDPGQNGNATVKESDQTDTDTAGKIPANIGSGKVPFNTNTQERALTDYSRGPDHALNKEAVPSQIVQKNHLEQVDPIVETLPTDIHTSNADPWDGMTEIRKEDITIPKDQAKLLDEQAKLCWLPPAPGQGYPQPNVPPLLLQQWNEIALQRSIRTEERRIKELETLELHGSRPSSSGATSSTDSAYETPSGDRIEWSQSPPRRQDLPADSSPPEARPVERPTMDKRDGGNGPSDQPPHEVEEERRTNFHQEVSHEQEELEHLPEGARESHESIALPTELRLRESGETLPQLDDGDDRTHLQERQVEFDQMSEDSVMDTSVPRPLGVDPSQSEQEIGSSDPSLLGLSTQVQVQVMETPAAHLVRFRQLTQSTGGASQESLQPGQSSSPAAKSSQSRICNTYRSNDEAKDHTSQDLSNSTQPHPHGTAESSEVNIMETQLSGGEWSFSGTTPSNSAQVLNSSGPRDREPSVFITASPGHAEESSNPFSSYREAQYSMQTDDGNGTSTGLPSPTQVTPTRHRVPQLKRRVSEIDIEQTPPSKRPKMACSGDGDSVQELAFNVISRRETYINRSAEHAEAQKVYEKFRSDYPDYDGDFNHFAMLCSKLQALRAKGHFQRSFLWDDFVITHLKEYEGYLNQIAAADLKILEYENFFASYILRPSYKKRSLTAKGIEISAAQHEPSRAATVPAIPQHETNTSFTGSLVDRFSNFHTRSFGPETPASQSATTVDQLTWSTSPASLREPIRDSFAKSRRVVEETLEMELTPTKVTRSHDPAANSPSEAVADRLERPTPRHRDTIQKGNRMVEEEEPYDMEVTPKVTRSDRVHDIPNQTNLPPARKSLEPQVTTGVPSSVVNREDDDARSIPETIANNDEVEQGSTDETHEIASVELGEDGRSTAPAADESDAESDAVSEADSFDEDWVGWHCRRLQSTGPFWSDDPNTPFKVLARADANVRSELLRRGMARFPVDERGVIQPLVDYPPMVSLRDLLDGPPPSPARPSDEPQG